MSLSRFVIHLQKEQNLHFLVKCTLFPFNSFSDSELVLVEKPLSVSGNVEVKIFEPTHTWVVFKRNCGLCVMDSKGKIEYFSEHHLISISESRCKTSLAVVIGGSQSYLSGCF